MKESLEKPSVQPHVERESTNPPAVRPAVNDQPPMQISDLLQAAERNRSLWQQLLAFNEQLAITALSAQAGAEQEQSLREELQAQYEELQTQAEEIQRQAEEIQAQNEELRAGNDALQEAHDHLESRVQERTAELATANEELQAQVEEIHAQNEERERLLAQVQSQHRLLEAVIRNVPAGVALLQGANFVFEIANPAYRAIAPGKSFIGKSVAEVWPELADQVLPLLQRVFETGEPFHAVDMALPVQRTAGGPLEELHFTFTYARLAASDPQDSGILVLVVETTDQVLDRKLKDQFISVAAHELKTPVTIMKGYAQALLRTSEEMSPRQRKIVQAVDRGADRIARIVLDLLDISQLHAGQLRLSRERVDLRELVEAVVDQLSLTTDKHRLQIARNDAAVVAGDCDRLEQVISHLLGNAMTYSPNGGDVEVSVRVHAREALVSVRDSGVGIPRSKQDRIFQRFYRAHDGTPHDFGGLGVGLYICREIIARHGGRMWFESEEAKGSTFFFSLPLA